jgi:hypothetical protein
MALTPRFSTRSGNVFVRTSPDLLSATRRTFQPAFTVQSVVSVRGRELVIPILADKLAADTTRQR